jgi:protocatechuate 3,4-dioxygenase beta subunit
VVVNLLSNGTVIATTTTTVTGAYAFTNLPPGDYAVEFVPPTGFQFTQPDVGGNDGADSDANPATGRTIVTTLVSGENDPTWDAGLYLPASLGNFVWLDADRSGTQDGGSETGLPDVVVNLLSNGTVIASTTTDVNGAYAFTNLPPGDYAVEFVPPTGFELTVRDVGGDGADSDADLITGRTIVTTLVSGENDPTWDAGLFQRASLGNFVWLDSNLNGVQDGGAETGLPDVVVNLLSNGTVIATTTTDVNGAYAFTNLVPSVYAVEFVLPVNYQFTTRDLGGDDELDSDADQTTGRTITTALVSGENDVTWDAGVYQPAPGIQLIKVAGDAPDGGVEYILPGEDVVYRYTIINTGNTYLTSITVTDDVLGVVGTSPGRWRRAPRTF